MALKISWKFEVKIGWTFNACWNVVEIWSKLRWNMVDRSTHRWNGVENKLKSRWKHVENPLKFNVEKSVERSTLNKLKIFFTFQRWSFNGFSTLIQRWTCLLGYIYHLRFLCEYRFSISFCHYTLNHSEWTNENTLELCLFFFFFHFNEKMFCFVFSSLIAYPKPTTNLCRSIYIPPKKKEKERKHQKERQTNKYHNNKTKFTDTIKNTSKCG